MAAIDKLIDLLEQIKQTDPDFTEKASNAIDALIGEGEENKVRKPPPRRKRSRKPAVEVRTEDIIDDHPEPIYPIDVEEEKVYPDVVEINNAHQKEIQDEQRAITQKVTELGLLQQNYESDKENILEYIEQKQKYLVEYIVKLQESYDLDPNEKYVINFPQKEGEKATFVKKQR
jgi:hypothetical protein